MAVGGPDRDDERIGGRVAEGAGVAVVAGGNHHDDPRFPSLLDRKGERIEGVGLGGVRPE